MKMPELHVRLAQDDTDLHAAQRLRYSVFVNELGGQTSLTDHDLQQERDRFDPHASHLLLEDRSRPSGETVIGTYRLMDRSQARSAGGFYSAQEYDLSPLLAQDGQVLELGRSCLHPAYRRGSALLTLWQGVARFVIAQRIDHLFGVASFHGTASAAMAQPLSYLYHTHRAPSHLRVKAKGPTSTDMNMLPHDQIDRKAALAVLPPLMKAYLRLGACVGDGAFVDHAFNTTDVCMIVDVAAMPPKMRAAYAPGSTA